MSKQGGKSPSTGGAKKRKTENRDEDLPRGGGGEISALELKKIHKQADSDFLFEMKSDKNGGAKKKGGKNAKGAAQKKRKQSEAEAEDDLGDHGLGELASSVTSLNFPKSIESLRIQDMVPGVSLLGAVEKIKDFKIHVSLPNNMMGIVPITEVSDTLNEIISAKGADKDDEDDDAPVKMSSFFKVGQIIPCVIKTVGQSSNQSTTKKSRKTIILSTRPSLLNQHIGLENITPGMPIYGSIKSIEDHGYVVSFGQSEYSGFLVKHSTSMSEDDSVDQDEKFLVGQLIPCIVEAVKRENKMVTLRYDHDQFRNATTKDQNVLTIQTLKAGMLINAQVKKVYGNGLFLTFLGYFGATVERRHIHGPTRLADTYSEGKKVLGRIIYVNTETRSARISLLPHIIRCQPYQFSDEIQVGKKFEAKIGLVHKRSGIIVDLPTTPSQKAFISPKLISDQPIEKLHDKYEVGDAVQCRVLGFNQFEGMVNAAMKQSILDLEFLRVQDVPIGQKLKGKLLAIASKGLVISLTGSIKAFCPTLHMSDINLSDPSAHFTVGSNIKCKALSVDVGANKVIVTCKKSLVSSDLPVITSYEEAQPGVQSHGFISSVKDYGVFVTFFNGVTGLVGLNQLSNSFVSKPEQVYSVGQVVKCHVLTCDPVKKRITLSFLKKINEKAAEKEAFMWQEIKPGSVVSGKVLYLVDGAVRVQLDGGIQGVIPNHHLSDHPSHCEPIRSTLVRGKAIKEMLVWSKNNSQRTLALSCKPYLIEAAKAGQFILNKEDLKPGMIIPATIRAIESYGCFIELINGIGGLAYVTNLTDGATDDPKKRFSIGQTVRAAVIDNTGDKLNFTLKPSQCGPNTSTSFLQSYFSEEDVIANSNPEGAPPKPKVNWSSFQIGSTVEATVKLIKDFGAVLTFDVPNVTGFAVKDQLPTDTDVSLEEGSKVKAVVLDIDKQRCIVDVSLRPELVEVAIPISSAKRAKKNRRKSKENADQTSTDSQNGLKPDETIECTVELIKGSYLVVSVPSKSGVHIGYVATKDFNTINSDPFSEFVILQKCRAVIKEVPSNPNGRLLLVVSKLNQQDKKKNVTAAIEELKPGMIVKAKITSVLPTQLNISLGSHVRGRVHITEIADDISQVSEHIENPLLKFKVGETVQAKVLKVSEWAKHRLLPISHQNPVTSRSVDLTLRPSDLALGAGKTAVPRTLETLSVGQKLLGIVERVTSDGVWFSINCTLKGRAFILDMSDNAKSLHNYMEHYHPGMAVTCYVKHIDVAKGAIDLTLVPNKKAEIETGSVILGRVSKILPHVGINMQLSPHTYGRAFITDLFDDFIKNPLGEFKEGDLKECFILGHGKGGKIDVSLRPSRVNNLTVPKEQLEFPEIEAVDDLEVGKKVRGYVQETNKLGITVALSRSINATITASQLGRGRVKNVSRLFPMGKLIEATVLKITKTDNGEAKVNLTMRTSQSKKKKLLEFSDLQEGMKVRGAIVGVRERTLLVRVKDSKSLSGMCHISEVSDDKIEDLTKIYKIGDQVKALVLNIDSEKKRFTVSLKPSHFEDDADSEDEQPIKEHKKKAKSGKNNVSDRVLETSMDEDNEDEEDHDGEEDEDEEEEEENDDNMNIDGLAPIGFDWGDSSATTEESKKRKRESSKADEDEAKENEEDIDLEEKKSKKKRAKRAQKLAEEEELRAKEDEILSEALPKTAGDYEKLLLASPNSSFLWIKYMAFQLSIAEIEKAREIAERALKRINYREEQEKLNVWVALMNLENKHGTNESLMQVFQRALTYNDPKAVHLQLIGIYERSEQYKLAEELYKAMVKKFKHSLQIWLRYSQFHLKCMHSIDGARKVLERALQVLPKKKHITVISKMAQMEFKHGSPERGRTIFEGIVSNYPKRVDIWGIYIDMELKLGDHTAIRNLFEKVTTLNLSSKKMRYFFERYLKFEREHGSKESVAHVREKARQYVLSKAQE